MKKWFTCRMTFPFVSARSPDPREVFEYPQHDRETSQTFSLPPQSQTLQPQACSGYSLFDPDWPNSIEIEEKSEKTWKNDQFWTFLKIKNDSDTFRVSSWYFCKALVAGYPSTTYGMVPWRIRRKLSSLFHQTENQKLIKIKENRYFLLNFS